MSIVRSNKDKHGADSVRGCVMTPTDIKSKRRESWKWSVPTWWTTPQSGNLVSPYHDNSGLSWTVSAPVKGIVVPVERHGVLQTLICAPVVRPKRCPTSSNPALLRSWTVVCPSFTLLMMLLLPGWPTVLWVLIAYAKKKKKFEAKLIISEFHTADARWRKSIISLYGKPAGVGELQLLGVYSSTCFHIE